MGPTDRRLLVLDDDEAVGSTIGLIAETAGFEATITSRFETFWLALKDTHPTHVTLDLNMPQIDGIEVLRRLAAHGFEGSVIISSGLERRVLEAAQRSAQEHGLHFAGALPKPFKPDDLRRLLNATPERRSHDTAAGPERVEAGLLRTALDQELIRVAYQPKVACRDGRVVGYEALARWSDPGLGVIPPDVFIPLAEREGLIDELSDQVFGTALAWLCSHDPLGSSHIALNLSGASLGDLELADRIERRCRHSGIDPSRVVLELTETASAIDQVTALDVLTRFRIKGLALSIDDFGTGHSTLVKLARQPFSELKIDRQFVMSAANSHESRIIVRAMIGLAHGLGLKVTAEGVEDAPTYEFLADQGCDRAQGYFIGRPMPGDEIEEWERNWVVLAGAGQTK